MRCLVLLSFLTSVCIIDCHAIHIFWVSIRYSVCILRVLQGTSKGSKFRDCINMFDLYKSCRFVPLLTRCRFTVPSNQKSQGSRGVTTVCLVYSPKNVCLLHKKKIQFTQIERSPTRHWFIHNKGTFQCRGNEHQGITLRVALCLSDRARASYCFNDKWAVHSSREWGDHNVCMTMSLTNATRPKKLGFVIFPQQKWWSEDGGFRSWLDSGHLAQK